MILHQNFKHTPGQGNFNLGIIVVTNYCVSGYPQGCECVETGVSAENCNLFKCTCVCDVTAGVCDYGCCCDPDCSSDQV